MIMAKNKNQTLREIEEYWDGIAIPSRNEMLSFQKNYGGDFYFVTGAKPYLPKEGGFAVNEIKFICTHWESIYCPKRAYITYWIDNKRNKEPIYIGKIFNEYNDKTYYTYWLYGANKVTKEFANAITIFLDKMWIK